ncbi:ABC-ATPase domain-containing protein [Vibrio chagasii]|nr:ABC-ATPase domain-containing protein [Vibrio chagasii]
MSVCRHWFQGDEPITPLVDRIGQLRDEMEISTIVVMGGSGDCLDVADTVIQMHDYQAVDVTEKAKDVIAQHPTRDVLTVRNTVGDVCSSFTEPCITNEHILAWKVPA